MTWIANFFTNLFNNIIGRILAAFGFSFVSFKGYESAIDAIKGGLSTMLSGLPSDIIQLLSMSGIGEGLGYIIGALTFMASLWASKKFTLLGAL